MSPARLKTTSDGLSGPEEETRRLRAVPDAPKEEVENIDHLVDEAIRKEREEGVAELERKIKEMTEELRILWDEDLKKEVYELENDLFKVRQAKDELSKVDFDTFREQIEELRLSLNALKGDIAYILEQKAHLEEVAEEDIIKSEEDIHASEGEMEIEERALSPEEEAAVRAVAEPPAEESAAEPPSEEPPPAEPEPKVGASHLETSVIDTRRLRGGGKKEFEPHRKAVIDIPEPLVKKILKESGEADKLFAAIISGDQPLAKNICHDLLERRIGNVSVKGVSSELEIELEIALAKQGLTLEQFRGKWKEGLYKLVLNVIQDRVDAETRQQAVAEISTLEKLKINWEGIAKKAAIVGGITAVAATGFGAVLGGAAAIGAGVATGGVVSRFFQGFIKKRREEGVTDEGENRAQRRMNDLIEKKKARIIGELVEKWQGDETSMSLVLSQAIREASAGNADVNRMIVQETLLKTAEKLKDAGEVDEAQARELEGLIAGLGNLRETDPELKRLIAGAEATPVAIEILKKLQEAKSGQLFAAAKGDTKKSKIEKVAGYLAPIAVGTTVAVACASGVSVGVRAGMGALGGGVAGFKMGEARDRAAKEKQVEAEINRMMMATSSIISHYKGEASLSGLKQSVGKLKAQVELFTALQPEARKSILLTKADAVIRESDRIILEAEESQALLEALRGQRQEVIKHASASIQKINKDVGRWRRWVGLAAGAVLGGGLGFLGGEMAEHRQELKIEEKLDELLKSVSVDVKEKVLQSFAGSGHKVHNVEDLTFVELKNLLARDGKTLDVNLVKFKIADAQQPVDRMEDFDSSQLEVLVAPFSPLKRTEWIGQGLSPEAIDKINTASSGGVAEKITVVDRLLAGAGGDPSAMRTINAQLEGGVEIETTLKNVLVAPGRGSNSVTALIARQLEANPSRYGFDAQKRFDDAHEWAKHEAAVLAKRDGYINANGTSRVGVMLGKKDNFVLLTDDGKGSLKIKLRNLGVKVTGKTYLMSNK
ncbi:MAG: hypothetical protein HY983_01795 [Candidatus Magasanikbacteria bacterium]|nr:hypothetical protein [Candidatus Magasanikbacteria bacterium]